VLVGGLEQRVEPAGADADVVVDEHHELAHGALDAAVAGGVQPERARERLVARAEARGQLARGGRGAGVVEDQHLGSRAGGGGGDGRERDLQVAQARARGDDDRGCGVHGCQRV